MIYVIYVKLIMIWNHIRLEMLRMFANKGYADVAVAAENKEVLKDRFTIFQVSLKTIVRYVH